MAQPKPIFVSRKFLLKQFMLRNTLLHLPNGVVYDLTTFDSISYTDNFAIDGYFLLLLEIPKNNLLLFQSIFDMPFVRDVSTNFFWHFLGYIHGFTIPDYKIETVNWVGNNEIEYSYPYKVSYDRNINITLYDTHDTYFQSFIHAWLKVSVPDKDTNFRYNPPAEEKKKKGIIPIFPIKANICIAILTPDLFPVFAMLFTGTFPTNSNLDSLGMTLDDIKLRTINISFNFDRLFIHPKILENLRTQLSFLYSPDDLF